MNEESMVETNPDRKNIAVEKLSEEDQLKCVEAMNKEMVLFLEANAQSTDVKQAERSQLELKIYKDTLSLLETIKTLELAEQNTGIEEIVRKFLKEKHEELKQGGSSDESIDKAIEEIEDFIDYYTEIVEEANLEPSMRMKLLSAGLNLIPYLAGPKMLGEAAAGKTLAGENLAGMHRLVHAAEGALWGALDTVTLGAGVFLTDAGKAALEASDWVVSAAEKGAQLKTLSHGLVDIGPSAGILGTAQLLKKAPEAADMITNTGTILRAGKGVGLGCETLYGVGKWLTQNTAVSEKANRMVTRGLEIRDTNKETSRTKTDDDFIKTSVKERAELLEAVGNVLS